MRRPRRLRFILVLVALVLLLVGGKYFGLQEYFDLQNVRRSIEAAGAWGYLLYVLLFVIGETLHVFGLIFVAAAVYVYGRTTGFMLALIGGTIAVSVSFQLMRLIGGRAFESIERPWVRRMLLQLDNKPICSVIFLRTFLVLHPSLNYVMALTNIRFRDYLIGSAVGLIVPIGLFVVFFDWLMERFPGI